MTLPHQQCLVKKLPETHSCYQSVTEADLPTVADSLEASQNEGLDLLGSSTSYCYSWYLCTDIGLLLQREIQQTSSGMQSSRRKFRLKFKIFIMLDGC